MSCHVMSCHVVSCRVVSWHGMSCETYGPGPPVTTKPDCEVGGFCGDQRPEGHVFHTSRQAMIKTYYSKSIRKKLVQNNNRRWNKIRLGCPRKATAPLILIFDLLLRWINIDRYCKWIAHFHNLNSPKHPSKNITLLSISFAKYVQKY